MYALHGRGLPLIRCGYDIQDCVWAASDGAGRLFDRFGRGDRIRTYDPLRPRQVRYQAALRPDFCIINDLRR